MKRTRREFIQQSVTMSAAAFLSGAATAGSSLGGPGKRRPNILLLMVDQQHMPPAYGPGEGMAGGLREILGFQELSPDNPFTRFFPAHLRLRKNAVVFRTHYAASSACVPSRTCIMTGRFDTGVYETDGMLKTEEDVPWLDPDVPTIGDWFRAAGYSTHYFGKWHVSYPGVQGLDPDSLEPWGFADWESSCPEPHAGGSYNAGAYRDVGFAQSVVDFLKNKGQDHTCGPWLAVGSLVNPHDVGLLPIPWGQPVGVGVVPWTDYPPPPSIPSQGQYSNEQIVPPPDGELLRVPLNPDGFPQENFTLPPTFEERLQDNNKPRCHYDYSLKFGLMAKALQETDLGPYLPNETSCHPFQFQGEHATAWFLAYTRFYLYCMYLADRQLSLILQALDEAPVLADNTIVVFLSDHGEMAAAHGGMIQKWYNAYQESIHVPMVISSPLVNDNESAMREILQPTSSIDLAPTLLALAGCHPAELKPEMEAVHGKSNVRPFVGANLSAHIKGEASGKIHGPDGNPRIGVFYVSNDAITEAGAHADPDAYAAFMDNVDTAIRDGYPLAPGTVTQPNRVRAFCTGDWKLAHYVDPSEAVPDEWELYYLANDPVEQINLVDFRTGELRDDVAVPGFNTNQLRSINKQLRRELARQEALMLG